MRREREQDHLVDQRWFRMDGIINQLRGDIEKREKEVNRVKDEVKKDQKQRRAQDVEKEKADGEKGETDE